MHRRRVLAMLGLAATGGCLRLQDGGGSDAEEIEVGPGGDLTFDPGELRVEPGTTVRWVWDSGDHNLAVRSQPEGADWSGVETFEGEGFDHSHTFEVLGEYEYVCEEHAAVGMVGTVVVTESAEETVVPAFSPTAEIDAVEDDWPQYAFDAANTSVSPTTAPETLASAWQYEIQRSQRPSRYPPIVVDGRVVTTTQNQLVTLDAASGNVEWVQGSDDRPFFPDSVPAAVEGTLYAGRGDAVSAHAVETGVEQWLVSVEAGTSTSIAATGDSVAFAGHTGESTSAVTVLDSETGDKRWQTEIDGLSRHAPAIGESRVYVQSQAAGGEGQSRAPLVAALDAATGDIEWQAGFEEYPTSPTVVGDRVFVLDLAGTAYALDAATGDVAWSTDVGSSAAASVAVADGTVVGFSSGEPEELWALDAATGEEQWRREAVAPFASPTVADGRVYTGGSAVRAYDLASGEQVAEWTTEVADDVSDPVVVDGAAFVVDDNAGSVFGLAEE